MLFGARLSVDLGTCNSFVSFPRKDIFFSEPSVVAVSKSREVLALGESARDMLGRTPADVLATWPLKSGFVSDFSTAESLLKFLYSKALGKNVFFKPDVVMSVPVGATSVESRALLDVSYSAGARNVYLLPAPLVAALGADLPVAQPTGNVIVSLGGGVTEIAVVSLYGIVSQGSVRVGGRDLDLAIQQFIRRKYGLVIGPSTAESLKISLGDALDLRGDVTAEVRGRDYVTGFPRLLEVSAHDLNVQLRPVLEQIALVIKSTLETTPPELSSDILDKGLVLCGGGALLRNVGNYLSAYVGVPVHIADAPKECVIRGLDIVSEHLELFSKSVIHH